MISHSFQISMSACKLSLEDLLSKFQFTANDHCPICSEPVYMHECDVSSDSPLKSPPPISTNLIQSTLSFATSTEKPTTQRVSTFPSAHPKKNLKQPNLEYSFGYLKGVSFVGKATGNKTKPLQNIYPSLKRRQVTCNLCGAIIGNPGALVMHKALKHKDASSNSTPVSVVDLSHGTYSLVSQLTSSLCSTSVSSNPNSTLPSNGVSSDLSTCTQLNTTTSAISPIRHKKGLKYNSVSLTYSKYGYDNRTFVLLYSRSKKSI